MISCWPLSLPASIAQNDTAALVNNAKLAAKVTGPAAGSRYLYVYTDAAVGNYFTVTIGLLVNGTSTAALDPTAQGTATNKQIGLVIGVAGQGILIDAGSVSACRIKSVDVFTNAAAGNAYFIWMNGAPGVE